MHAIVNNGVVLACVNQAEKLDDLNIVTEGLTYCGEDISIIEVTVEIPAGHIFKNGVFDQLIDSVELAEQTLTDYMNAFANEKNYDTIINAALRAGYSGPFHDEGVKYATWMDGCWAASYEVLAQVQSGTIPIPTKSEFLGLMPPKPEF